MHFEAFQKAVLQNVFLYSYNTRSSFTADNRREKVLGTVCKSWRMLEMLQFLITHLRDLLCHAMKQFYFSNWPAKYANLNYIYVISETSKHLLEMLLKSSPKDGQLVRNTLSKEYRGR